MELLSQIKNVFINKRITFFILLFFVLGGIIVPLTSHAFILPALAAWGIYKSFSGGSIFDAIFNGIILVTAGQFALFTGMLTDIVAVLVKTFMAIAVDGISYTESAIVKIGWPIVRDLANMVIILGFVVVAIATTLRINEYGAKKLLPKLIGVMILINFSLVFCGIFIDASNIVTKFFLRGNILDAMASSSTAILGSLASHTGDNNAPAFLAKVIGLTFFNIVTLLVLTLYFFLFAFRIFALWILVILSPLAFVAWIFPMSKNFYNMWLKNFIQWCIIGAPAAFFLYLASRMQQDTAQMTGKMNFTTIAGFAGDTAKQVAESVGYFVPGLFIIIGFLFALKTSAMGADMVTSRARGAFNSSKKYLGNLAGSSAKLAGGRLADVTGVSQGTKYMQNKYMELKERMGLAPKGSATEAAQESTAKEYKRLGTLPMQEMKDYLSELGAKKSLPPRLEKEMAAMGRILVEQGEFDVNDPVHIRALKSAQKKGFILSGEHKKKNPLLSPFDTDSVDKILKGRSINPLTATAIERADAEQQSIADTVQKIAPMKYAELHPSVITSHVFSNSDVEQLKMVGKRASPALKEKFRQFKVKRDSSGKKLPKSAQTKEWNDLFSYAKAFPKGSPERKRISDLMKELNSNANFD